MTELADLDATAQADLVRTGEVSPAELVEAAIGRIEAVNPRLNAVIHERFAAARAEAAVLGTDGPFAGVPFLVKDMDGELAGEPMHMGTRHLRDHDHRPAVTSTVFQRFIDAGLVICGKTNCPELGLVVTTEPASQGPTRNPWDTERSTGGSSGGSAAAVAAGMVPLAHGGDGGGSIRIPASECGLVGLKPTRARATHGPTMGNPWDGLVVWGGMTRSVRDTARLLDVVAGAATGDAEAAAPPARPYAEEVGADPGQLRIGVRTTAPTTGVASHPECDAAVTAALRALEAAGHAVTDDAPAAFDEDLLGLDFLTAFSVWVAREVEQLAEWTGEAVGPDGIEPTTRAIAELGSMVTGTQYHAALEGFDRYRRAVCSWWDDHDVLVTPTLPTPPPPLGHFAAPADEPLAGAARAAEMTAFTVPCNITGQPAISLPLHWSADGLPVGVQLVAAHGREDVLIQVAAQLEQALPWADRRPPVWSGTAR